MNIDQELADTKNYPSERVIEILDPAYQALKRLVETKLDDEWVSIISPNTYKPWTKRPIARV